MPTPGRLLRNGGATLFLGGSRRARSGLISQLAEGAESLGARSVVLSSDLGLPMIGPPGAVSRGSFRNGGLVVERLEALATFDAARYRLPLLLAVTRAMQGAPPGHLWVDAPNVRRGMAGAELVAALVESLAIRSVVLLGEEAMEAPFRDELRSLGVETFHACEDVFPEKTSERSRERTRRWDEFLDGGREVELPLDGYRLVGAPPPRGSAPSYVGRQVALLGPGGGTLGFGEIRRCEGGAFQARVVELGEGASESLLVRDAARDEQGLLSTRHVEGIAKSAAASRGGDVSDLAFGQTSGSGAQGVSSGLTPPVMSLASAKAFLVNGIFGDPLLHVRLRHRRRSLLFDLGDAARLQARVVHQVSDVFVSHAHFDHIGGFLWLLRTSIGAPQRRTIYGPPGLCDHLEGMIRGIRWDRIGDRGPVFDVAEVHADRLERFRLQAGVDGRFRLADQSIEDGALLSEPDFRVKAVTLDHGIPVLGFSFEETKALHVRADRLTASGLPPGPWLSELKRLVLGGEDDALLSVPEIGPRRVRDLASDLLYARPGEKLVYATDFDDHEENHRALTRFAEHARVLYCEASFVEADRHLARLSQHLTARSCGRIAAEAGVEKLVPFHFSKRYESEPERVYREVIESFPGTVVAR